MSKAGFYTLQPRGRIAKRSGSHMILSPLGHPLGSFPKDDAERIVALLNSGSVPTIRKWLSSKEGRNIHEQFREAIEEALAAA